MILSFKTRINGEYTYFREKILTHLGMDAIQHYYRIAYLEYSKTISATESQIQEYVDHASVKHQELKLSPKKLTIRDDPHNRWSAGRKIHFATGARTKQYECFAMGECKSTDRVIFHRDSEVSGIRVSVGANDITAKEIEQLAQDDGFDDVYAFLDFHLGKNTIVTKKIIYF